MMYDMSKRQFIDPLILMREARREAGRRISFLIAEKSMRRRIVGSIARAIAASENQSGKEPNAM